MADRQLPSPEVLRQLLRYEPETGKLFWKERGPEWFKSKEGFKHWQTRRLGAEALTSIDRDGYRRGLVCGHSVMAHRVAWAIHAGHWPKYQIDHVNGVRDDNRLLNLREATASENARNRRYRVKPGGIPRGVKMLASSGKWQAEIGVDGRKKYLGVFDTKEAAQTAYLEAAPRYHGVFAAAQEKGGG